MGSYYISFIGERSDYTNKVSRIFYTDTFSVCSWNRSPPAKPGPPPVFIKNLLEYSHVCSFYIVHGSSHGAMTEWSNYGRDCMTHKA